VKPANLLLLKENLKGLNLANMFRHFEEQSRQASEEGLSYGDFLLELTDIELRIRTENRNKRRIRDARFPLVKPLNTFDFRSVPDLNKRKIMDLATCEYIKEQRNIIFMGRSGAGKTHLATAWWETCKSSRRALIESGAPTRSGRRRTKLSIKAMSFTLSKS
jgi:DNA replication protein DnaC